MAREEDERRQRWKAQSCWEVEGEVKAWVCYGEIYDDYIRSLLGSVVFFFSSRRRHTRSLRDWSSDGALPIFGGIEGGDCSPYNCALSWSRTVSNSVSAP